MCVCLLRDYISCLFAVLWSLLQTCFHLGWCMWGADMYECKYNVTTENHFNVFLYLTYFYTNSCINANALIKDTFPEQDTYPILEFPQESALAPRTYNIFRTFIAFDVLWIISAFALLVGTCCRIKGLISIIFFFPWSILLLIILFFDAIASVWYGLDIHYTNGLTNWLLHIGGKNQSSLEHLECKVPRLATSAPSIFMTAIFGRFFVIWLVNLCLLFRIIQAGVNAADEFDDDENRSKNTPAGDNRTKNDVPDKLPRNFQVESVKRIHRHHKHATSRQIVTYSDTEDEGREDDKPSDRRYSERLSKVKQNYGGSKHEKKMQKLTISGGYEGDRSNSPSPLPKSRSNPAFYYSSGYDSSDKYSVDTINVK